MKLSLQHIAFSIFLLIIFVAKHGLVKGSELHIIQSIIVDHSQKAFLNISNPNAKKFPLKKENDSESSEEKDEKEKEDNRFDKDSVIDSSLNFDLKSKLFLFHIQFAGYLSYPYLTNAIYLLDCSFLL